MKRELPLKILLGVVGVFFAAAIYPILTTLPQHNKADYPDQMMLSVYWVLGMFLLLAIRNPPANRSLILFAGWSSLAHTAVMVIQDIQLGVPRSEFLGLGVLGAMSIALLALAPRRRVTGPSAPDTDFAYEAH